LKRIFFIKLTRDTFTLITENKSVRELHLYAPYLDRVFMLLSVWLST